MIERLSPTQCMHTPTFTINTKELSNFILICCLSTLQMIALDLKQGRRKKWERNDKIDLIKYRFSSNDFSVTFIYMACVNTIHIHSFCVIFFLILFGSFFSPDGWLILFICLFLLVHFWSSFHHFVSIFPRQLYLGSWEYWNESYWAKQLGFFLKMS